MSESKQLTTQELAQALQVSDARVRQLRLAGRLPGARQVGGTWVYPAALATTGYVRKKAGRKAGK